MEASSPFGRQVAETSLLSGGIEPVPEDFSNRPQSDGTGLWARLLAVPRAGGVWSERLFRELLFRRLRSLTFGQVQVIDGEDTFKFGQLELLSEADCFGFSSAALSQFPAASITIVRASAYRKIVLGGDLGFADCLVSGDIEVDNLVGLVRMMIRNSQSSVQRITRPTIARKWWSGIRHWFRRNTRRNSLRNIQAHYDLSNEFFSLWLDQTLSYSSGVFPDMQEAQGTAGLEWNSAATMEQASLNKLALVCQKLDLKPSDHLVEIGCGWGGLAVYAAKNFGCRVTGVTLSKAQLEVAQQRVRAAGLQDQVTLKLMDYRDLPGQYDKLVSIEMVEAVGHEFLNEYFRKCCQLLKPDGRMVLQGITIAEQRYQEYLKKVDFIREYIFPGGCLISNSAVLHSISQVTDFRLVHQEEIGLHYAETLRRWRAGFRHEWTRIESLGFDERFFRIWDYYLAYCEAGFAEGHIGTVQIVLDRAQRLNPLDSTKHYQGPGTASNLRENFSSAISDADKREKARW